MKPAITIRTVHSTLLSMLGLVALLACTLSYTAQAQAPSFANLDPVGPTASASDLGIASSLDPAELSAEQWKTFCKEQTNALTSSDEGAKERALQNIIFATTHYASHVDFGRATHRLYNIYRFDDDEGYRIMALAALHAIGKDASMRLLGEHVRWETSDRIRHMTQAVLADYYVQ